MLEGEAPVQYRRRMRLVVVCTANQVRSVMAAALLGEGLRRRGAAAEVVSAGFGPSGQPATAETVAVLSAVGLDVSGHRSRTLDPGLLRSADLLVGMTRQHAVDVAMLERSVWPRTFTLVELVGRGAQIGRAGPGETLREWAERATLGRRAVDLLALPLGDDIADPIGQPLRIYERTRERLGGLCEEVAELIAPAGPGADPTSGDLPDRRSAAGRRPGRC